MEETPDSAMTTTDIDLSLLEKVAALPAKPGVYQFKNDEGKVISDCRPAYRGDGFQN
jgi:hypothetical protein